MIMSNDYHVLKRSDSGVSHSDVSGLQQTARGGADVTAPLVRDFAETVGVYLTTFSRSIPHGSKHITIRRHRQFCAVCVGIHKPSHASICICICWFMDTVTVGDDRKIVGNPAANPNMPKNCFFGHSP